MNDVAPGIGGRSRKGKTARGRSALAPSRPIHVLLSPDQVCLYIVFEPAAMEALKAEIALKRKTLEIPAVDGRPTKYMRKGDIERLKEEQERKAREEKEAKEREKKEKEEAERLAKLAQRTVSKTITYA